MKKILILALLVLSPYIYSQPKFTINVFGGYNLPLPDLKGDVSDSVDREGTYVTKNGFNAGLIGKYAVDKKGMFRITLGGSYNSFSGEGDYIHTNNVSVHNKINIITIGAGAEYAFLPKGKANPFLGVDLTGNFFSGEYEETTTAITDHDEGTEIFKLKSASRFGIGVGGGVDFAFSKNIGGVVGFKYHLSNLIGRDYDSIAAVGEYNLNDKESGSISSKNISYFQFYAGVSFYFGHPKKMKK
ncbi:MAG: PorT family protein [Chlorobi bacterium]|nr:PorT family protein [Chlorobiota bacterium]MCI0716919.1 PorT family protein [Chlorobiota bacterium]